VIYSRKIWAQDLLPVFVVAVVLTGLLGFGENRRWARWLHWPLLGLTLQIHYASLTLIPLSLLMIILWFRRSYWRDVIASDYSVCATAGRRISARFIHNIYVSKTSGSKPSIDGLTLCLDGRGRNGYSFAGGLTQSIFWIGADLIPVLSDRSSGADMCGSHPAVGQKRDVRLVPIWRC
jgi:hypothetical protein